MHETILVVPTVHLTHVFADRGFVTAEAAWPAIARACFVERAPAEQDESLRQVIPYVVLRDRDRLFTYARNRRGNETRLHDLRSVGVGGHVNPSDLKGGLDALAESPRQALALAAGRELAEEVSGVPVDASLEWIGFIFDDAEAVSRVHVGVVYAVGVDPAAVRLTNEGKMVDGRFVPLGQLAIEAEGYEGWSRLTIAHLASR